MGKETRPARIDVSKLDNKQVIQLYYKEPEGRVQLTAKQEELKERWEVTFARLKKWHVKTSDVINDLTKEFGVDARTVREDIKVAKWLFGEELKLDWDIITYKRISSLEQAIIDAHEDGDFNAVARLEGIIQKYKPKDLDNPIDPDKIQPHTIVLTAKSSVLKKQIDANRRKVEQELAEDAQYEDIT